MRVCSTVCVAAVCVMGCTKKVEPVKPVAPAAQTSTDKATGPKVAPHLAGDKGGKKAVDKESLIKALGALNKGNSHRIRRLATAVTDDQKARLEKAKMEIGSNLTADEKVDLLDSIADIQSAEVIRIANEALDDKDEDVRVKAMEILEDYDSKDIVPVVSKALADGSAEVRAAAINALYYVNDPQVQDLLDRGLGDKVDDVRSASLDMIADQAPNIRNDLYRKAVNSQYEDVVSGAVSSLEDQSDHQAMATLIEGLKNPSPELRSEITDAIDFLVSQQFTSYDEAVKWWKANQSKYDNELFEKD